LLENDKALVSNTYLPSKCHIDLPNCRYKAFGVMKTRIASCFLFVFILLPHIRSISEAKASISSEVANDGYDRSSENSDADTGTDEYGRPEQPFRKPFWNVWQEESSGKSSPAFKPTEMAADQTYLVVIDLAAIAYEQFASGVYSSAVNDDFDEWLKRNPGDEITLTVLALPDERYFEALDGEQRIRPLTINLDKLRRARLEGFQIPANPFSFLARTKGEAPYDFGFVTFPITTRKSVSGEASIAFSFWSSDQKPVTELRYTTCVKDASLFGWTQRLFGSSTCSGSSESEDSIIGVDTNKYGNKPDAAIHLVELNSETLIGVFRCNTCGWGLSDFKQWKLAGGADWFQTQIATTVLPGIRMGANGPDITSSTVASQRPTYNENTLNNAADSFYRLLFPSEGSADAESAFQSFIARSVGDAKGKVFPSLFIRLLPQHARNSFVPPLGLIRVPLPSGQREFLGFQFRIQTPLRLQDYSQQTSCPSKWVLLMPPVNLTDNALTLARDEFRGWIEAFNQDHSNSKIFWDVDAFKQWLEEKNAENVEPGSYAVMILSHHENNSFFIDRSISSIYAPIIAKKFGTPSIAIIDACGTANPISHEFVKDFNSHGVYTVVASSVEVDARMGGDFLNVLVDKINEHSDDRSYTIENGVHDALLRLRDSPDGSEPPVPYGARALVYSLIGNGNVRFCVPKKANRASNKPH
jgi:hypothetical protein